MSDKPDLAAKPAGNAANQQVLETLLTALGDLRFGQISLTIHEGRVVQIDVTERKPFTNS